MPDETTQAIKYMSIFVVAGIAIVLLLGFVAFIPAGYKGVLLTWGRVEPVMLDEGIAFKIPIMQNVVSVSTQTLKFSADAGAASKDLQIVTTQVALNYHLDAHRVNEIYQMYTLGYETSIISPAIQESVKASTAKFNAEQLITERSAAKQEIEDLLSTRLAKYGIIVEAVSITDFDFSEQFNAAIESKVTAEQLALKAKNDLERIKVEAEQQVVMAQGEADATIAKATAAAESIRIQGQALKENPNLVNLKIAEKWNGVLPVYMFGEGTGVLFNLNNLGGS